MNNDQLLAKGAYALYLSENSHRVGEFKKVENSCDLIAGDFEKFKDRYVRKFEDLVASLASEGLSVQASA